MLSCDNALRSLIGDASALTAAAAVILDPNPIAFADVGSSGIFRVDLHPRIGRELAQVGNLAMLGVEKDVVRAPVIMISG